MKYTCNVGEHTYEIRPGANQTIEVNGEPHHADLTTIDEGTLYSLLLDNHSYQVLIERQGDEYRVSIDGELYVVGVQDERTRKIQKALNRAAKETGEYVLKAPMPGLVRGVPVQTGQEVMKGQGLVILEAMKMENELRAARGGVVSEIRVKPGDAVELGQALVVIQ